jgi:amino-acid N-acetyltransferase
MNTDTKIRRYQADDKLKIEKLLASVELAAQDLSEVKLTHFFVLPTVNNNIIATIGLEPLGNIGLLRSLAVDKRFQDSGYGSFLITYLEKYSYSMGLTHLFLLTTTALDFFLRKGYRLKKRIINKYRK